MLVFTSLLFLRCCVHHQCFSVFLTPQPAVCFHSSTLVSVGLSSRRPAETPQCTLRALLLFGSVYVASDGRYLQRRSTLFKGKKDFEFEGSLKAAHLHHLVYNKCLCVCSVSVTVLSDYCCEDLLLFLCFVFCPVMSFNSQPKRSGLLEKVVQSM